MILTLQLDCGLAYWYIRDTVVEHYNIMVLKVTNGLVLVEFL